jgi:type IV pilus assembly protein PilW
MSRFAMHRVQIGLTLIELMISITIGLVVVGAVTYVYVGSKGAYRGNESLARIQEAGRFALDSIARDIRRAGALGCGSTTSITPGQPVAIFVAPPLTLVVGPANSIQGFAPTAYNPLPVPTAQQPAWTPPTGAPAYWGGDVLQLQIASGAPARVTATPDTTAGTITIADNGASAGNFKQGDYALLANCSAATVLQITGNGTATPATAPAALGFAGSGGVVPAITASGAGAGVFSPVTYPTLQHFDQVTYYVGKVPNSTSTQFTNGLSALYRYSASSGQAEELVENIEDMDVVFGVDTSGATPPTAGTFAHASGVTDWTKVISVRVSVVAVGDQLGAAPSGQVLLFRGPDPNPTPAASPAAPDTRLRQVFVASAALRDRIQFQ